MTSQAINSKRDSNSLRDSMISLINKKICKTSLSTMGESGCVFALFAFFVFALFAFFDFADFLLIFRFIFINLSEFL